MRGTCRPVCSACLVFTLLYNRARCFVGVFLFKKYSAYELANGKKYVNSHGCCRLIRYDILTGRLKTVDSAAKNNESLSYGVA
jgi:hypothetical protein